MNCCNLTPVFLVLLRLAIGWHLLFEGIEKINSDSWTSQAYLRESSGPLAPFFRSLAGDAVEEKLTVPALPAGQDPEKTPLRSRMPPALARDWQAYYDSFSSYYPLDTEQQWLAKIRYEQRQDQVVYWILNGKKVVRRSSPLPPPVEVELTTRQRFQEYIARRDEARRIQDQELVLFGEDAKLRSAKAEANRLRWELLGDINQQTAELKVALTGVLTPEQRQQEPLPEPIKAGATSWTLLQWTDFLVKYGLTALGSCLLLGLFTRTACLGGAALLLMFYLALPAFLGVPDNPRAEGHYLFVNKNIIEMLALLALATTPSGRWVGIDALFALWRRPPAPPPAPNPLAQDLGAKTPRPDLQEPESEQAVRARAEGAALAGAAGSPEDPSHGD